MPLGKLGEFNIIVTTQRGNERACMRELITLSGDPEIRFRRTDFPGLLTASVRGDPVEFCRRLRVKVEEDPWRVRFVQRVTPIQVVVEAATGEIRRAVKELAGDIPEGATFRITVNKRGTQIHASEIIREVAPEVERKVDLENPDFIVEIEIIKGRAGVSVIRPDDILAVTKMQEEALEKG